MPPECPYCGESLLHGALAHIERCAAKYAKKFHGCPGCRSLEAQLSEARRERDEARERSATATELLIKGEALREKMMFESILAGAWPPEKA